MTEHTRKNVVRGISAVFGMFGVSIILLLHNAWGDDRYELKAEAIVKEIARIDTELTVLDQEIIFAENDRERQKYEAIKAIYEREKEALSRKLEK